MVLWSLHANQATKSEFITQLKLYMGLSLLFFFLSISLLPWKMLSNHLNYWVESVFGLIVNKRLWNIWLWILHCKTILIWKSNTTKFFTEFSLVQYWMFLFLKRSHVTWHVGFVLGFFSNWKKLWWPLHWSRSSSHLCWMCSWQERGELVTVLLGHPLAGHWGSWIHFRCRLEFPAEQSQESHGGEGRRLPSPQHSPVFVLCLQCLLTTASPLQLLLVALVCALARETPTQEKVMATASRELCQPRSLVSCFGLSVVLLIPFLQGGLEDAAAFTCRKWKYWWWILRSWSVSDLKCKQGAEHRNCVLLTLASSVGTPSPPFLWDGFQSL